MTPVEPAKQLGLADVKQMAREVYKKQGYIVIGWPRMPLAAMATLKPGYRTAKLWQYEFGHEFEAVEYGTVADWIMQNELIAHLRPKWMRFPDMAADGIFLRMRPYGAKK